MASDWVTLIVTMTYATATRRRFDRKIPIFNAKITIFDAESTIFNAKSTIFNAKSTIFQIKSCAKVVVAIADKYELQYEFRLSFEFSIENLEIMPRIAPEK